MKLSTAEIREWVDEHIGEVSGLKELASQFGISQETLRKEFKRCERVCISRYIRLKKLHTVQHMLIHTDNRCNEIIYAVKLGRPDSAARLFKREVGMTMKCYRRGLRRTSSPHEQPTMHTRIAKNRNI